MVFRCFRLGAASVGLLLIASHSLPAAAPSKFGANWPQWRGPDRDGIAKQETGLLKSWPSEGPPLLWKAGGLGQGFAGVSIQNGRIFTMGERDGQECLFARKLSDGTELWHTPVGPTASNGGYPGPRCTPTANGTMVYGLGSAGDLVCCSSTTGKVVWKKNFERDFGGRMMSHWGYSESPLVDGERLVCTPGGSEAMIVALDKRNGREIWRSKMPDIGRQGKDGAGYSSIVISQGGGTKQYVQLVGRGLISVSADDGRFLWGYNRIANKTANIPTPLVEGDYVFCSTGYNTGSALLKLSAGGDGVEAEEVYFLPARKLQNHHGGLVLKGDYIYGGQGHKNGFPICIEWKTGRVVWGGDQRGPGSGSAAVAYADGRLYFRYEDGLMALIEATPRGYNLVGTFEIPDVERPSWPHPVIADGKLYLREQDALLCYDLK